MGLVVIKVDGDRVANVVMLHVEDNRYYEVQGREGAGSWEDLSVINNNVSRLSETYSLACGTTKFRVRMGPSADQLGAWTRPFTVRKDC